MKVELLDVMGDDSAVAEAARVSFNKNPNEYTTEQNNKLIAYLAKHNHWSPFAHCILKFRIAAPIFVARQLAKHQVGFAWNEVSRRYVDYKPDFWWPISFRKRADNVKQGSSNEQAEYSRWFYGGVLERCLKEYNEMLDAGVCPEQARAILPQATYTEWIWTGSLYGWSRVCNLRLSAYTQAETREIAQLINEHCSVQFPVSWKELMEHGS